MTKLILILLLLTAALFDLMTGKIPNILIAAGMAARGLEIILQKQYGDVAGILARLIILYILLWAVYQAGGLGAGDCKLLLMTGTFQTWNVMIYILLYSFLLGSVWGLGKRFLAGEPDKIHFAPFILFGTLLTILL